MGSKPEGADDHNLEVEGYCQEAFKCNVCGCLADYVVHLELVKERSTYNIMQSLSQMPFYLCKGHEHLYKRMQGNLDLKQYFSETINGNR